MEPGLSPSPPAGYWLRQPGARNIPTVVCLPWDWFSSSPPPAGDWLRQPRARNILTVVCLPWNRFSCPPPPAGDWLRQPWARNFPTLVCLPWNRFSSPPPPPAGEWWREPGARNIPTVVKEPVLLPSSFCWWLAEATRRWLAEATRSKKHSNFCQFTLKLVVLRSSSCWWLAEATRSKKHCSLFTLETVLLSSLILLLVTGWGNQEQETLFSVYLGTDSPVLLLLLVTGWGSQEQIHQGIEHHVHAVGALFIAGQQAGDPIIQIRNWIKIKMLIILQIISHSSESET